MFFVILPVQAVTEDIFIWTARPRCFSTLLTALCTYLLTFLLTVAKCLVKTLNHQQCLPV